MRSKTDPEFNRLLASQFLTTKAFYDYGVERGLTNPDEFRMTIEKRKAVAKQMVDSGMSRRQIAVALGVHHTTVMADLGGGKSTKNGGKSTTPPEEMPTDAERTNSTGHIVARAMEVFEPKFREWLASNPSKEAKLSMHSIMHASGETLIAWSSEIFGDEEE